MKLLALIIILYFLSNFNQTRAMNMDSLLDLDAEFPVVFVNILMNQGESMLSFENYATDEGLVIPTNRRNIAECEQITNTGIKDEYEVGIWLRSRYSSLLHQRYYKPEIYVSSIDTDSSLASAQAAMAGMFQPRGADVWHEGLNWQPVPVHVKPFSPHRMVQMNQNCKKDRIPRANSTNNNINKIGSYDYLVSYISNKINCRIEDTDLTKMYNIFQFYKQHNLTLPEWAPNIFPKPLEIAQLFPFHPDILTEKLKKQRAGPLLKDMVSHFSEKIKRTLKPDRNIWVYSGIGTYISYLLSVLKTNRTSLPKFSDLLLLELRQNKMQNNSYFVSIFYKSDEIVYFLKMTGCELMCPFDKFKSLVKPYLPREETCKGTSSSESYNISILISGLILTLLIQL